MIPDFQKLLKCYLDAGNGRTPQSLAARAGVGASSLRRILQGEVKTVSLANVLSLLKVVATIPESTTFLKRHFPEAGSYFEAVASSAHIAENVGEGLEKALLDFDQFAIISLAGTPSGTDAKQVNDVLGIHAERKLEALLDAGFLVAKSGKVFTSQDEFGISDNQVIATEIGHALRFVRDEHIGKQMQHLALHTKGLTRDGQKLAHAVIQEALIKLLEIGQNHKGNIPVFFAAAMGTFTSEGVSK